MKIFRLFKRGDDGRELSPEAPGYRERDYYYKFMFRGERYVRCLETNDAETALSRAKLKRKEITEAVIRGEYKRLDQTKIRQADHTSLETLYSAYRSGPSEASADTRELNINALNAILATTSKTNLTVGDFTPVTIRQYFQTVTTKANTLESANAAATQADAASLKRSANSRWAQAKSLFTDRCLAHYQDQKLLSAAAITQINATLAAGELAKFSPRSIPKILFNPPAEEIVTALLKAWNELTDRDLYLTIGHELAFGLRAGEMSQATWSWWNVRNGYPVLDGAAKVKNGTALIQVRALDPWFTQMQTRIAANHWRTNDKDLIIPGTDTYRTDGIFRAVSDFMRNLGWQTKKTNHALRAYAGSQIAMRYGIYEASAWCRHSTVKVTEQHYTHFVNKFKPADLETMEAKWATVHKEFIPTIVTAAA